MEDATNETAVTGARPRRKVREGVVRSNKMDKTVVVDVVRRSSHPQYNKTVQHNSSYIVHDEENTLREGDKVRIVETRPMSKTKRWRLAEILERAR
jgi:small subunit ribosomal protein S17